MSTTHATPPANTAGALPASELQTMIADSVDRLFAEQVTPELKRAFDLGDKQPATNLWNTVQSLGLERALVPADADGSGATWSESYPLFRALGFWQAPLPLAETMLAGLLLARAGLAVPTEAMTVIEAGAQGTVTVTGDRLSGRVTGVPWASSARWAVIATPARQLLRVDLRQDGAVQGDATDNLAGEPRNTLTFHDAHITAQGVRPFAFLDQPVWTLGALTRAAMLVGALESVLTEAVQHANTRVQFGKPLGKFQALQQALAAVASSVGAARVATKAAFAAAPVDDQDAPTLAFDIAVAKVRTGEAATLAAKTCHQVLGAIGFTRDHTLHFATRRLWSWRAEFGSDADWAAELGRAAIAAGSRGFWAGLTARRL